MLVFVDEAGDTGFKFEDNSSRYFLVTLVIFEDEDEAEEANQRVEALRQEQRRPGLEFHFAKNKIQTRKAFLVGVRGFRFSVFALVADKHKLLAQDYPSRSAFYKEICGIAFERAKPLLQEAKVIFDESGNLDFNRELATHLSKRINSNGGRSIKSVGVRASSTSNMIQFADMICGAIYRSLQEGEEAQEYLQIIKHRVSTVLLWPEKG